MDAPPSSTLDYAPASPGRRVIVRWVTWGILLLAAIGSGWVVIPRVVLQAERVRAQGELLENRATPGTEPVAYASFMGSRSAFLAASTTTPGLTTFTTWAGPRPRHLAAYAGGRTAGGEESLVIVYVQPVLYGPSRPSEVQIEAYVYAPGGWTDPPTLLSQSITTIPFDTMPEGQLAVLVYAGTPTANDPSAFDVPLGPGYEGGGMVDDHRPLTLRGRLLKNDSLRFEILEADDSPDSSAPKGRNRVK